jgi:hypothetical protein
VVTGRERNDGRRLPIFKYRLGELAVSVFQDDSAVRGCAVGSGYGD